ncbi:MAG: ribbon-helix-helix protein, CopG family [Planctomycetes bacterium]|nr:ribbon-helix-helix protein, CopG family [Planctomycetota bacterium]
MMKSVRLDEALEHQLEEAARVTGRSVSTVIREAVRRHCDDVLAGRLDHVLSDVIGVVGSGGGRSRRTGREFTKLLKRRSAGKRRKR